MRGRGQQSFVKLPRFAARLYENLTATAGIQCQQREIAAWIAARRASGRLLDLGCGPGGLLLELRHAAPGLRLYGLDISSAMVERALARLAGQMIEVRQGDARASGFPDNFFDAITSTGSFYLWDEPVACLNEIFRILQPGRNAWLFESHSDCDREAAQQAVRANLRGENLPRRLLAPRFFAKQLAMTYREAEIAEIVCCSRFASCFRLDRTALAGVPAFVRLELVKAASA